MRTVVTLFFCTCLATLSADDKGAGKRKDKGHHGKASPSSSTAVSVHFGRHDVHVIQQYYRTHAVSLPPGLQKRLARGKPLPPGWQKKLQPFPSEIDVRLGPPCGYCARGVIDGYGLIYDKKRAIILDVVRLVGDILR